MAGVPKIMLQRLQTMGAKVLSQSDDAIRFVTKKGDDITLSYQKSFNGKTLPTWTKKEADGSYSFLSRHLPNNGERSTLILRYGADGTTLKTENKFKYFNEKAKDFAEKLQEWKTYKIRWDKDSEYYTNINSARGEYFLTSDGPVHWSRTIDANRNIRETQVNAPWLLDLNT